MIILLDAGVFAAARRELAVIERPQAISSAEGAGACAPAVLPHFAGPEPAGPPPSAE